MGKSSLHESFNDLGRNRKLRECFALLIYSFFEFYGLYRVKNLFCQKNNPKKFEFKNKVLPLQSLIVLNDTKVLSFTNLVILSIYLKHNTQTPTLSVIARLLSIWSEVQSLAGKIHFLDNRFE